MKHIILVSLLVFIFSSCSKNARTSNKIDGNSFKLTKMEYTGIPGNEPGAVDPNQSQIYHFTNKKYNEKWSELTITFDGEFDGLAIYYQITEKGKKLLWRENLISSEILVFDIVSLSKSELVFSSSETTLTGPNSSVVETTKYTLEKIK